MEQICPMLDKILQCLINGFQVQSKEVLNLASMTIRISEEEKEQLAQIAEEMGVTLSWVVRKALKDYLEQQK